MNTKNISTLVQLRKKNLLHKMYYSISLHNYRRVKSDNNTYIILNLIKIKNLFFLIEIEHMKKMISCPITIFH